MMAKKIVINELLVIMVAFMNFTVFKIVSMMFVFNGNFRVERLSQVYFLTVWQLRPKITLQKLYY